MAESHLSRSGSSRGLRGDSVIRPHTPTDSGSTLNPDEESDTTSRKVKPEQDGLLPSNFVKEQLDFMTTLADCFSILCPLAFLVFSIVVLKTHGRPIDKAYAQYRNAITTLATAFPILFAATIGRLMYQISRWKLERGATMRTLEQLMGSRTLGATALTHAELCTFNLLSLLLIVVWIWSPVGGQALLRMLDSRLETIRKSSEIVHFDTDSTPQFISWDRVSVHGNWGFDSGIPILNSIYNAALLSPDSIPFLPSYGRADDPDWQRVPAHPEYSALVGIPLTNILTGNTSFLLESSYIHLECSNVKLLEFDGSGRQKLTPLNRTGLVTTPFSSLNGTWVGDPQNSTSSDLGSWTLGLDRFIDPIWADYKFQTSHGINSSQFNRPSLFADEAGIEARQTSLLIQVVLSSGERPPDYVKAQCGVSQHYVESGVNCSLTAPGAMQNCTVIKQRPSQRRHAPGNISLLSFPEVFEKVSTLLPPATGMTRSSKGSLDPSLRYLQNPSIFGLGSVGESIELHKVSEELFSYRLGQLINSYLLIGQAFPRILGGSIDLDAVFEPNVTVPVEVESLVEVYHVSVPWTAACIFSCFVFLTAGILSVVFIRLADGPDVLGFVSTAVRDSKHMDVSPEGARMSGLDLTMTMMKRRVRYGFVQHTAEGEGLLGVGREENVEQVKARL